MNGPPLEPLLEAAEYHLSQRNFDSCRSYALRALKSAPNHTGATQILAVSDTLSASATRISETLPDWYAILQIYRYSQDSNLIRDQAKKLSLLLHENKFPFADEAFKLVHGAWSVLSNPFQKAQFDNELQMFEFKLNDTFWTVCPYCYHMYEYLRVYEDCCLRCQNKRCGRGFHAVTVKSPPLEVVEKGHYTCMGFFPLGFDGGEIKGVSSWSPFSPMVRVNENVKKNNDGAGVGNECNRENFVELSGESNDSNYGFVRKNVGTYVNDSEVVETRGTQQKADGVGRPVVKRMKKSVPRNAKKLMGKGSRIGKIETVAQSADRLDLNAEAGVDDADGGNGNGNELGGVGADVGNGPDFDTSGVELFAGDDDIFVSFPDCF